MQSRSCVSRNKKTQQNIDRNKEKKNTNRTESTMSVNTKAAATSVVNNTKAGATTFKDVIDECLAKAKQQAEDDNPPCIPDVPIDSDEEDNNNDNEILTTSTRLPDKSNSPATSSLKSNKAASSDTNHNGGATVRLMTAEEALCLYMGLKQTESAQEAFYAVLGKCTEVVKQKIKEYQTTAVYVFPAPLLFHDREYLLEFLTDQLHFTVSSSSRNQLCVDWHNEKTKDQSMNDLHLKINTISQNNRTLYQMPDLFIAYHACLAEIERDLQWKQNVKRQLTEMIQTRIADETSRIKRSSFVVDIPVAKFFIVASPTTNDEYQQRVAKEHQTKLLLQAFKEFLYTLQNPPYSYEVTDQISTTSKMKFRLSIPGFTESLYCAKAAPATVTIKTANCASKPAASAASRVQAKNRENNNSNHQYDDNDSRKLLEGYTASMQRYNLEYMKSHTSRNRATLKVLEAEAEELFELIISRMKPSVA